MLNRRAFLLSPLAALSQPAKKPRTHGAGIEFLTPEAVDQALTFLGTSNLIHEGWIGRAGQFLQKQHGPFSSMKLSVSLHK